MPVPQLLNDILRFLLQLAPVMAMVTLVLAGIALRLEGGTTFAIGGGFTKWMFWAVMLLALPQLLLWFGAIGLPMPPVGGAIGTVWLATFQTSVTTFVSDFVVGRLTLTLAAFFVLRAVLDTVQGSHPLPSILTAMFLLAIPTTATLLTNLQTATRFSAVDVLDGLWTYLASQIMPVAAGLAVIGAIFNFVTHRPAMRLIACALGFLTVSALWRLVLAMM
jgi:hypothetical protein